jgi:hypothetical protein
MMYEIKERLLGRINVLRLHLPGLTSPSALQLMHSVKLHSMLTPRHLTTLHDATRKAVLRRLGWAVKEGLLREMRPVQPDGTGACDPYWDVLYLTTRKGSATHVDEPGPIAVRTRRCMYTIRTRLAAVIEPPTRYISAEATAIREVLAALLSVVGGGARRVTGAIRRGGREVAVRGIRREAWAFVQVVVLIAELCCLAYLVHLCKEVRLLPAAGLWAGVGCAALGAIFAALGVNRGRLQAQARRLVQTVLARGNPAVPAHSYSYRCYASTRSHPGAWQGRCECGWASKARREAPLVHAEYRQHIIDQLGHEIRYEARVRCGNCCYDGPVRLLVGMPVSTGHCPRCWRHESLTPMADCEHRLPTGREAVLATDTRTPGA